MIIKVKAIPGSSKSDLIKISDKEFKAYLKSQPEKGKANEELISLLSKYFGIPKSKINIKNPSSRIKLIELQK